MHQYTFASTLPIEAEKSHDPNINYPVWSTAKIFLFSRPLAASEKYKTLAIVYCILLHYRSYLKRASPLVRVQLFCFVLDKSKSFSRELADERYLSWIVRIRQKNHLKKHIARPIVFISEHIHMLSSDTFLNTLFMPLFDSIAVQLWKIMNTADNTGWVWNKTRAVAIAVT